MIVVALAASVFFTRGPEPATPNPAGTWAFAALGDAPYYLWEEPRYRLALRAIDASDLAFAIHVGDIFWKPCSDEHYREKRALLDGVRHPVIYTPGDNETYDCWEAVAGGYRPQERFAALRRIFFADPTRSLGGQSLPLLSQGGEFVENARWSHAGVVFATADLIGSWNGMKPFPGRTADDDTASRRRTEAAASWVRETFAEAHRTTAPAVVLACHAFPGDNVPEYRPRYEPFVTAVEEEAERFARPVLLIHGDGHRYRIDHPLRPRNFTRLQVPGSPKVGWVKVVVDVRAREPFAFERHVVPRWKLF